MFRKKYKFDNNKLEFIPVEFNFKRFLSILTSHLVICLVLGVLFFLLAINFLNTPAERKLNQNNSHLALNLEILLHKTQNIALLIEKLAIKDNQTYRPFFELETIPSSIRDAGFGGIEHYLDLKGYDYSDILIKSTAAIDVAQKKLYIQTKSYDEIIEQIKQKEKLFLSIPAIRPVEKSSITGICTFGMRTHPILGIYRMHKGVDLCAPEGKKVIAPGNGKVVRISFDKGLGNFIIIYHGFSYQTVYGHLSKVLVKVGDKVERGQTIGLVGTTGTSNVTHLHYEVYKNGVAINPMKFFIDDLTDVEYQSLIGNSSEAEHFMMYK